METPDLDLGAVLQQLLDAPVLGALHLLGFTVQSLVVPDDIGTVQALFTHPAPPLELLDAIFLSAQTSSTVPRSAADVLQLAALSVAMNRCGFAVPESEQPMFRNLFNEAMHLEWIDEATREILDDGLTALTTVQPDAFPTSPSPQTAPVDATPPAPMEGHAEMAHTAGDKNAEPADASGHRRRIPKGILYAILIAVLGGGAIYYTQQSFNDDGPQLEGWIESINGLTITGWAWDSHRPRKPVEIEFNDGVHPPVTVRADVHRSDLRFDGEGTTDHGFIYEIPRDLRDGKTYTLTAKIAGTNYTLNASPQPVAYAK